MNSLPLIGEKRIGTEVGKNNRGQYIYAVCPECGESRWTQTPHSRCRKCADSIRSLWRTLPDREYKVVNRHAKYRDSCPSCNTELWRYREYIGSLCVSCAALKSAKCGTANHNWKGGRAVNRCGYVEISILRSSPYFSMARSRKNTVLEHRSVVAQLLGRCLESWEVVHHKNGIKTDNRAENLELVIKAKNVAYTRMESTLSVLKSRIVTLERQIGLLQWQVTNLQHGNPDPSSLKSIWSRREGVETRTERTQLDNVHKRPTSSYTDKVEDEEIVHSI